MKHTQLQRQNSRYRSGPPQILDKLVENHLHRLYIVDGANKPVGVVTLTDILRVVTDQSH